MKHYADVPPREQNKPEGDFDYDDYNTEYKEENASLDGDFPLGNAYDVLIRKGFIHELGAKKPFRVEDDVLCALVNDVLYIRYRKRDGEMRVYPLDHRKRSLVTSGDEIAYDTVSATRITLLLKDR